MDKSQRDKEVAELRQAVAVLTGNYYDKKTTRQQDKKI